MLYSGEVPEIIRFGRGVHKMWQELLLPGKVLFICGRHSLARINDAAKSAEADFHCAAVSGELPLHELEEILKSVREGGFTNIIGWGGGSAMDGAKAVAALLDAPLPAEEYFYCRAEAAPRQNRLILIPTTAGTGAEITANAVIRDQRTNIKQSLRGKNMTADAALVDPELLETAPAEVTASAGFDALTQALESFTSAKASALTQQLAATAAQLILENLEVACSTRAPAAFDAVARGSMLTGIAFASSGLGAVHGLAHPLGSLLNIPHGECCAILLLPVLRRNAEFFPELFDGLARAAGFPGKEELFRKTAELQRKLGIAENFRAYGLKETDFPFIIANCRSGSMKCNRYNYSNDELAILLKELT